ncbi:4-(cytidine 5'-diphospho)-2-C-methyl-D-erythritol kinase [Alphaproteobacteria bacterium]|nr:4-(cytidine 5'-diphospho)-2-C-methyl-D-erythritol kinase [Alphaproteobacteria bacterium]
MNKNYYIKAPAKLNLNLTVKKGSNNGLHFLESDICFLELTDTLSFQFSNKDIFTQDISNKTFIVDPKDNLILRALKEFRNLTNWRKFFSIYLQKKIPVGAGLGGGSADAAATLILLRKLFNNETKTNKVSKNTLFEVGKTLGSDVPACIESKDLKLKGYGDKIFRNKFHDDFYFLIINPNIQLSTKDIFIYFDDMKNNKIERTNIFWDNINIQNSLLKPAIKLAPEISSIINSLANSKKIVAYGMTGSGSSCFGIFKNLNDINASLKYFNKRYFIWFGKKKNYSLNRVCYSKVLENKF